MSETQTEQTTPAKSRKTSKKTERKALPELPPLVEADFDALEAAMQADKSKLQPVASNKSKQAGWQPASKGESIFGQYLGSYRAGPKVIHRIATKREGVNVVEEIVGGRTLGRALRIAGQRAFVQITFQGTSTSTGKGGRETSTNEYSVAKL